ncbi:hypothetical protein ACXGQW_00855 [Wenyingzhuangia sp. IMCC45533]
MKQEEKIAKNYFNSIGFEKIIFEPKGQRTPDFELNNKIAVEVRRLNIFKNEIPLEKIQFNIIPKIRKQIENFGNINYNKSAFVGITYSRPLNYNIKIKKKISSILEYHSSRMNESHSYEINNNLKLDIFPSEHKLKSKYFIGASNDLDNWVFVLSEIIKSLKQIIPEKYEKILTFKSEYNNWWLALIDNIGYGIVENELVELSKKINFDLMFDRILIISPCGKRAVTLKNTKANNV